MQAYTRETKGILYSYLICLPLLLLYEILILISQPDSQYLVRISVDVWFKSLFDLFGLNTISTTLLVATILGGIIVFNQRGQLKDLKAKYFGYMILESIVYAIVISVSIGFFLGSFLNISADGSFNQLTKLQQIALSLGAGLYEELFFRVILVGLLLYFFKKIFTQKKVAFTLAAIVAALLFSGVHYIGNFADTLTLSSFLFRFLFGLALNLIYVIRGFGMAAWTHAIYDLFVIMKI